MLKALDEIQSLLEKKAAVLLRSMPEPDPDFLPFMTLTESSLSADNISAVENQIGHSLPDALVKLLLEFDFDGLELGAMVFGDGSGLERFLTNPYAQAPSRHSHRLTIGGTSGYAVLIDLDDGTVYAQPTESSEQQRIAGSFELFLKAVATVFLEESINDEDAYSRTIGEETGADPSSGFWRNMVKGFA